MLLRTLSLLTFSILLQYPSIANMTLDDVLITSDKLILDKQSSQADFSGVVVIYADNMVTRTTRLIVKIKEVDNKRSIERLILPAKLTAIKQADIKGNEEEIIMADSAEYDTLTGILTFKGNIYMQKSKHWVKCK
ncbi:MAG: LptA/OstA family protein, partial [Pseudomonadota bacterium]